MRTSPFLAALALMLVPVSHASAEPVEPPTVLHDVTFTQSFDDDICGARASTTTFHRKMEQVSLVERKDGSFRYRDVSVVTYESDYVDPALPDLSGRLTEVNSFILTPGDVFVGVTTFHDFFGSVRIRYQFTLVEGPGGPAVFREVLEVTGCP